MTCQACGGKRCTNDYILCIRGCNREGITIPSQEEFFLELQKTQIFIGRYFEEQGRRKERILIAKEKRER